MYSGDILSLRLDTPVEEAARTVSTVRHRYFPVLDEFDRCVGMVSHRNLMQM